MRIGNQFLNHVEAMPLYRLIEIYVIMFPKNSYSKTYWHMCYNYCDIRDITSRAFLQKGSTCMR